MEKDFIEVREMLKRIEILTLLGAKNVFDIGEASLFTGLSKSHLYRLTCTRQIPHYKNGKLLYFDRKEIEDWMKQGRVKTQQEAEQDAIAYVVDNPVKRGRARV